MKRNTTTRTRGVVRTLALGVVAALAATSVAACGQGSGGSASGGEPDTFRYANAFDVPTFDPLNLGNPTHAIYLFPVYDRLVHLAPDTTPEPGLAESWEYSDDVKTLTMKIREGVTFSDGETMTAEVAKANLDRYRLSETSSLAPLLVAIESVEAPDPQTLVIQLSEPDATLLHSLGERPGMMISPAALDSGTLDTTPVGSGPYVLKSHQANDRAVYERRDDYWNPDVEGVKHLEIRAMTDASARANALTSNEVDAAASVSYAQATQFADNDDFIVDTNPTTNYYSIIPAADEFQDVNVRTAVSLAIDRDALVDAVLEGYGEPLAQPWSPGTPAHNPDLTVEHDVEQAKKLLTEAGYPDGFEFEMIATTVDPSQKMAEAIQQMLAEAGITMTIKVIDSAELVDTFFVQGNGGAYVGSTGGPPSQLLMARQTWLPEAYYQPLHLNSPEFVKYYNLANAEPDPQKQSEYMQLMTKAIHDGWLTIPLASNISPIVVSKRVENFVRYGSGVQDFADIDVTT